MDAETKRQQLGIQHHDREDENRNRQLDRQSREKVQVMELVRDIIMHPGSAPEAERALPKIAGEAKRD